jgi:hypothetical protein
MKKLLFFGFLLITNLSFGQIRKAGDFYELNDLWKRDSVTIKKMLKEYDINISKLDTVQFFENFDFNLELHDNYSHNAYSHVLYKKTGQTTMKFFPYEGKLPRPNKYVMIFCFDDYVDKKIINIKVF